MKITIGRLKKLINEATRSLLPPAERAKRLMSFDAVEFAESRARPEASREEIAASAAEYVLETALTSAEYDALTPEYLDELKSQMTSLALGWL